jgi:hypothetical protein
MIFSININSMMASESSIIIYLGRGAEWIDLTWNRVPFKEKCGH